MKSIFVTGASGALGSALVPELLRSPENRLILLLRPGRRGAASRLEELKDFWRLYGLTEERLNRIEALEGDMSVDRLGISEGRYKTLVGQISHIVHAAANVKINMTKAEAHRSSVATTEVALRLAKDTPGLEKLEYISTVGVAGQSEGRVPEERLTDVRRYHNTYESSKAEAEDLVWAAMAAGLPVTIHRPSMVVGDSRDGKTINFQVFYHLAEFLSGRATLGWIPRFPGFNLDIIPNDYVAKAVVISLDKPAFKGQVLHLASGRGSPLSLEACAQLLPGLMRAGGLEVPRTKRMPWGLFRALVPLAAWAAPRDRRKAFRSLPRFLSYLKGENFFDNQNTRRLLEPEGLRLPTVESYLPQVMGFYGSQIAKR